ncbi:hypothetical protein F3Y22_tig00111088pilonHSYRG00192 [Hibiscus syriacus]|uniref:Pentatricopeptide repeat-containing protein n=1 Tax=Hibiscus syriacus TaxID=106335 RepID=A0A6A2Z2I6_HIBSY|nr:hypothetical protein F3Y22_tig00111088pilonHSYRG00192 [Hibiscus syriacus]
MKISLSSGTTSTSSSSAAMGESKKKVSCRRLGGRHESYERVCECPFGYEGDLDEGLVSWATFASVFSSYVRFDKVKEAVSTFEVMDEYGCVTYIVAYNTLISAICREGKTIDGLEFLRVAKSRIKPALDSYAILLEGWENEGNASF